MTTDEQIIRLLTEIRDNLREESDWRRKAIDESARLQLESARLQRLGILQHRIALAIGGFAILAGVLFLTYYLGLFGK
jgi:hypothetical protein